MPAEISAGVLEQGQRLLLGLAGESGPTVVGSGILEQNDGERCHAWGGGMMWADLAKGWAVSGSLL